MIKPPQLMLINFLNMVLSFQLWCFVCFIQVREEKVKVLTPREAGYAMQLSNKTLLDVRPSTEHKKVNDISLISTPGQT